MTADEVARGKGFPDIYLLAAGRLGLSPGECAVFEDILAGIRAAREGGFFTVGVADASNAAEREALRAAADAWLEDFAAAP